MGHQIIGQVFGSKIIGANKLMHGKTSLVNSKKIGILKNLPKTFTATRYHSLIVEMSSLPTELEVTATLMDNKNVIMALKHKSKPIYGVQFHPESIDTYNGKKLIENFLSI